MRSVQVRTVCLHVVSPCRGPSCLAPPACLGPAVLLKLREGVFDCWSPGRVRGRSCRLHAPPRARTCNARAHTRMPQSTRASRPLHIQRWQCLIACKQSAHHASARSFCPLKHERTPAPCTSRAHQRQHTATGARTLARPAAARELFRSAIHPPGAGNCPAQLSGTSFGRQGSCLAT